jgi:hypothetical protein
MLMLPTPRRIETLLAAGDDFRAAIVEALKRLWNAVRERLPIDAKPAPVPVPVRVRR